MKDVKQPRALETREKILQAAASLFALKGYHDTKLEEVLDTAQVTKGAFFHHFRDREDLGFAVLDWHMDRRRQLLDAIEQELPLAERPIRFSESFGGWTPSRKWSAAGRAARGPPPRPLRASPFATNDRLRLPA